jgi:phage tail-like protein
MPWIKQDSVTNLGAEFDSFGYDLLSYEFHLEVDGKLTGTFQSLVGGEIEVKKITHDITYETGASTTLNIPGTTSFQPFTLGRGLALYFEVYRWLKEASDGNIVQARRDGSVYMRRFGETLYQWDFYNAWPTKLATFNYNSYRGSAVARVSLTISAETIELVEVNTKPPATLPPGYFDQLFSTP